MIAFGAGFVLGVLVGTAVLKYVWPAVRTRVALWLTRGGGA